MTPYVIGALSGPLIGLVVGFAVAWLDPDGYLRNRADALTKPPDGPEVAR